MKRIEIIANHSVENNIMNALSEREAAFFWTKIPAVQGMGYQNPKIGDETWPEENFIMVIYCRNEQTQAIKEAVNEVRKTYPEEGIALFEMTEDNPEMDNLLE